MIIKPFVQLRFVSSDLCGDADLALAAIVQCGKAFEFCSPNLRRDRGFVLRAAKVNGHVLQYIDEAGGRDETVTLKV